MRRSLIDAIAGLLGVSPRAWRSGVVSPSALSDAELREALDDCTAPGRLHQIGLELHRRLEVANHESERVRRERRFVGQLLGDPLEGVIDVDLGAYRGEVAAAIISELLEHWPLAALVQLGKLLDVEGPSALCAECKGPARWTGSGFTCGQEWCSSNPDMGVDPDAA